MQQSSTLFSAKRISIAAGLLVLVTIMGISCTKKQVVNVPDSVPDMYYSPWMPATWTRFTYNDDYGNNDTAYTFQVTSNSITQNVIDSGVVLAYIKYSNVATAYSLPYFDPYSALTWWMDQQPGSINFNYGFGPAFGGADPGAYASGNVQVRFIVLNRGIPANSAHLNQQPEVLSAIPGSSRGNQVRNMYQQMSYDQVCNLLGIPK